MGRIQSGIGSQGKVEFFNRIQICTGFQFIFHEHQPRLDFNRFAILSIAIVLQQVIQVVTVALQ